MKTYGDGGVREKRSGQWQCYFNLGGKQVFRAGGETEQEAWKQLRRYQKQAAKGDYTTPDQERMTIGDLLDGYAKHLERKGAKSPTHASLMVGLRKHLGMERALDSKIHEQIDAFVAGLRKSLANASINRYLQALRAAYRVALKRRAIPWVPHFELLKEDNVRTGFFEESEWAKVRAELPQDHRDFCQFGYVTGWRRGSVTELAWALVDRDARELRIPTSKTGKPNILPLEGELWEIIERRWQARIYTAGKVTQVSPLVFHRGGHPMHSTRKLRKEWREACVKAEVVGKLPFHDFRRTAVRNFIRSGVHETVAMSITGHLTRAVFDRYCVTSTADRADALERVQRKPGRVIPLKGGA